MRWAIVIVAAMCGISWSVTRAGDKNDVIKNRSQLEQVKREVDQGKKRLDSLKSQELKLQKTALDYDQRATSGKKIVSRLGAQLDQLRSEISEAENQQEQHQLQLEEARTQLLGNIRQFYLVTRSPDHISLADPNAELIADRQVVYLTAVTGYQHGNIALTTQQLSVAREQLENLTGKSAELEALKRRTETSVAVQKSKQQKAEKELARVRRLSRQQSDRLVSLEQSAREMENIISRLEAAKKAAAQRPKPTPSQAPPSGFALQAGSLPMPYAGDIVQSFGTSVDPVTNLKSYSPGISIKGKAGGDVVAIGAGTVAYVGNLRGYGTFVIISHEDQYYTTYAGLADVAVSQGDRVTARTKLGVADQTGLVRFELRKGRDEVDPVKWLNND